MSSHQTISKYNSVKVLLHICPNETNQSRKPPIDESGQEGRLGNYSGLEPQPHEMSLWVWKKSCKDLLAIKVAYWSHCHT